MHSAAYNSEVRADPHGVPFGTEPTPSIFAALWLTLIVPSVPLHPILRISEPLSSRCNVVSLASTASMVVR